MRPLLLVPVWVDGILERTCAFPELRKRVKMIWDRLADQFLEQPFVRQRDTWNPNDLVDGLQRVLKFSKRLSVGWAAELAAFINGIRGGVGESYSTHALAEQDFRNRRARHIVYGHTHYAEMRAARRQLRRRLRVESNVFQLGHLAAHASANGARPERARVHCRPT